MDPNLNGILLVDKPIGISSFGVVARVRGIIKAETGVKIKIGHTGTLDPLASGLMILVLGKYTKRAGEFSKLDKTYEAELTLGATSSTGDTEGEISQISTNEPALQQIEAALKQFTGKIQQTPHKFSAIKIDGQRAYKLARAGKEVKLEPREVEIYKIELLDYSYPTLKIRTAVSSGTYIRSLAEDIGEELSTGAYMSALRRTQIGEFDISKSVDMNNLNFEQIRIGLQNHP